MSENLFDNGFGDLFGLTPVEKKETKKTPAAKKKSKDKSSSRKKSNDKKYDLPIQIHTEWGVVDVVGNEKSCTCTLEEIEKMLDIPQKITEKDGIFVATFPVMKALARSEEIKGFIFKNGQTEEIPGTITVDEFLKGNFGFSDKMEVYNLKDDLYVVRYPNDVAANWNLKISGMCHVGFSGNTSVVRFEKREYTLKEAVEEFNKENSWMGGVEKTYFFDQINGENYITVQLSMIKVDSSKTLVKLPCEIRFLHDAGPLADGLKPEMFNGKEYVTDKEILKLVDRYFPQIYQEKNTSVTYVDSANTVCVLHIGRTKGASINTGAGIFNIDEELTYKSILPHIPTEILLEITQYFKDELPTEAIAQIVYNKDSSLYRVFIPDSNKSIAQVSWDDAETLATIGKNDIVVMEIHSHNTMEAFFSSIDDADETLPMLYGVIGNLDTQHGRIRIRAGAAGKFCDLSVNEIFKLPMRVRNGNTLFVRLAENRRNGLYVNVSSGEYVLAKGIEYAPDGAITWGHGIYLGTDFFNVDWNFVFENFSDKITGKVIIREIFERIVSFEDEESIDDIKEKYKESKIVLDSSDFTQVYFLQEN